MTLFISFQYSVLDKLPLSRFQTLSDIHQGAPKKENIGKVTDSSNGTAVNKIYMSIRTAWKTSQQLLIRRLWDVQIIQSGLKVEEDLTLNYYEL